MKTTPDTIVMLRDQIEYVNKYEREWVEIDQRVTADIADDLESARSVIGEYLAAYDAWDTERFSDDTERRHAGAARLADSIAALRKLVAEQ